jgi:hypothetical protein
VAFGVHCETANICVTAGTDGMVNAWDVDAQTSIKSHSQHNRKAVAAVACVRCCPSYLLPFSTSELFDVRTSKPFLAFLSSVARDIIFALLLLMGGT